MVRLTAGSGGHLDRGLRKTIDWRIIVCYVVLVLLGWINIYAAVRSSNPSSILDLGCNAGKQGLWIATALVLAAFILFVLTPRIWEVLSTPAYVLVEVLLVAVIFLSSNVKGSHSWFELGPVKFQPAEISKITTSLLLAMVMSRPNFKMTFLRDFLIVAAIIALPMLTIVAESETGSALVYVGFIFVLYREGLSGWYIVLLVLAALIFILTLKTTWWVSLICIGVLALAYVLYALRIFQRNSHALRRVLRNTAIAAACAIGLVFATDFLFEKVLEPHQQKRIEVLLGITEDPMGTGYNQRQSLIAIGSGGFAGKGFLKGTQTTYGFVPEQSTDFIFCTVGEEWGFLGCLVVIMLYFLLIWFIIEDADKAREGFTRIYGYCVAACLFMHLGINISMTLGMMPVIGIPLPLFSYGGSSLWAFTAMIFIFIALNRQEKKYF